MEELELSANRLAKALDVPVNRVTGILREERGITADTALRLARYFNSTPEFWLNLQSAYALETALTQRFEGLSVLVTPPVQLFDTVDLGDPAARARAVWALSRWRATPAIRMCRPEQPPEPETPPAEGEAAPARLDSGETFIAELAAVGVSTTTEGAPACQRGDINTARLSF